MTTEVNPIADKWEDDHLNRVVVAQYLTAYLNSIYAEDNPDLSAGHFVLNLNANWGQGKTFLLHKWAADLRKNRFPVITFDAWKNDFSKDPLVGFVSELNASLSPWFGHVAPIKAALEKTMDTAKKLIGLVASVLKSPGVSAGIDAATGVPMIGEAASTVTVAYSDLALGKHKTTKELIEEFRIDLTKVIEAIEAHQKEIEGRRPGNKEINKDEDIHLPMYVFIDELDRCRPTYAIELLENIKHLFGVRGVFFVVATNKEQLCHSISAVYGNSFDSAAYLGRFFDQEYTLPEPDNFRFAHHLFEKYQINDSDTRLFVSKEKRPDTQNNLAEMFAIFCDAFDLPLRDQEQTIHRIKAILANYQHDPVYFDYLVFLLMLRKKSEPLFDRFFIEYPKNRVEFEVPLSKIFKGQKTIRVPKVTYHGGAVGVSDETLFSLIHLYASMATKDLDIVHKESRNFEDGIATKAILYRETSSYKAPGLAIREYPKLVRQVGQLN